MRGIRALVALFALFLAACGDGRIRSPDFSSELVGLNLSAPATGIGEGETVQLTLIGAYSAPPGASPATIARPVPEASYTVSGTANVASVSPEGLVTTTGEGTVTIT